MNALDTTKIVVGFVVASGVSKIVNDVIANNIEDPEKFTTKVSTLVGAAVIGMMAKDASKKYVSTKIDSSIASWQKAKAKMKENQDKKSE